MEELKISITELLEINNTIPFNESDYNLVKLDINRIFTSLNDATIDILRLEGFCGLRNQSNMCYLNSAQIGRAHV